MGGLKATKFGMFESLLHHRQWEILDQYFDWLVQFDVECDADKFVVFLNQQHPNLKFKIEKQMHNLSFTPISYKIGLVKTLHQAFVVSWSIFHLQLGKMKELLEKNL